MNNSMLKRSIISMCMAGIFVVIIPVANADLISWTGSAGDNNWFTASNWAGVVPTANDDVRIWKNDTVNIASGAAVANYEDLDGANVVQTGGSHTISDQDGLRLESPGNGIAPSYTLHGGTLDTFLYMDAGSFSQDGGIFNAHSIDIKHGRYNLSNGTLNNSGALWLHNQNTAIFNQTGGVQNISLGIYDNGNYNFTGGNLNLGGSIQVGINGGTGYFKQGAGTQVSVSSFAGMVIGNYGWGHGKGTYELTEGTLDITKDIAIGQWEQGNFVQHGGYTKVGRNLLIGEYFKEKTYFLDNDSRGNGFYLLDNNGQLEVAGSENIGIIGAEGYFLQNSGQHNISGDLTLGQGYGYYSSNSQSVASRGVYELNAGVLSVNSINMGYDTEGIITQNGGTVNVGMVPNTDSNLAEPGGILLGLNGGAGRYYLNNGTINAKKIEAVNGYFYQQGGQVNLSYRLAIRGQSVYSMTGGTITTGQILNYGFLDFKRNAVVNANLFNNGSVFGEGVLHGTLYNEGSVFVGNNGPDVTGKLIIDENLFTSSSPSNPPATYLFDLGGYQKGIDYDFLHVLGDANFDGLLKVALTPDFNPAIGSVFNIIEVDGSLTGAFKDIFFPDFTDGRYWTLLYDSHSISLQLMGEPASNPVPEPAPWLLMVMGMLIIYRLNSYQHRSY